MSASTIDADLAGNLADLLEAAKAYPELRPAVTRYVAFILGCYTPVQPTTEPGAIFEYNP